MYNLKKPLTYSEQLEKLKAHNMIIEDSELALTILSEKNYYRFTGYALQQRVCENDSDFVESTSFNKVYQIYRFDETLRNFLKKYIEIVEIYFRTQISYNFSISKCINPPHDQHYDENNYCNKKGFNDVMANISHDNKYYHDSLIMQHHMKKYNGKLPLWAMVEMLSFSNLSKLYACMYFSEQNLIAAAVGSGRSILKNHLHCLSLLRNKCAHAARLYNTTFSLPAKFNSSFLKNHPEIKANTPVAYILVLLKRLPNDETRKYFSIELQSIIEQFADDVDLSLIGFPCNYLDFL